MSGLNVGALAEVSKNMQPKECALFTVWDEPCCTEHEVSVNRGSRVVMACNISDNLRDVTIELITREKTSIIFNQTPPGNYSKDSWQLHIQGGQAQLVITDAQGKHSGEYWWKLRGFQAEFKNFNLIVNGELCARK